jgi:hypothetical protein
MHHPYFVITCTLWEATKDGHLQVGTAGDQGCCTKTGLHISWEELNIFIFTRINGTMSALAYD